MKKMGWLVGVVLLVVGCCTAGRAQAKWYTPEVRRQLGQEVAPGTPAEVPPFQTTVYKLKNGRVVAGTVAFFDTIATYAQGRVVDARSHRPVQGALVQVRYGCFGSTALCGLKTAVTDGEGFFRLGWVGCGGPLGGRSARALQVTAVGYPPLSTQRVGFGGAAYLHIELAAPNPNRPGRP